MCGNCSVAHLIHRFLHSFSDLQTVTLPLLILNFFLLLFSILRYLSQYFPPHPATVIRTVSSVCVCFPSDFYFITAILIPLKFSLISSIFPLITSLFSLWFLRLPDVLFKRGHIIIPTFLHISGTILKFPSGVRKKHPF